MSLSVVENIDCMTRLREAPDNHWDLAICDPPYGLGATGNVSRMNGAGQLKGRAINTLSTEFDNLLPDDGYFIELFRVSVNQMIWGGNYFSLPPTRGICIWDKKQPFQNFSAFELCWTSFDKPAKIFTLATTRTFENKIHPTQKPVALYKWLLKNYAKPSDKILDTHLGSQSSRIAAWDLGFDFVGYELDEDYFREGNERFERHGAQPTLFEAVSVTTQQTSLFTA